MQGEFWVADLLTIEEIPKKMTKEKFNIIEADTGSGKTKWAVEILSKYQKQRKHNGRILFITDTRSNKQSLLHNYKDYTYEYTKFFRECINKRIPTSWRKEVVIMTYAQLAVLLHFNNKFDFSFLDFVIFDEIHALRKQKGFVIKDNSGKDVEIKIKEIVSKKIIESLGGNPYIIGMTATPRNIYKSTFNPYTHEVFSQAERKSLFHYTTGKYYGYSDITAELNRIPKGTKGLIYTELVRDMENICELLKDKGHKAEYIFSLNSEKHAEKLTDDRKNIIDTFVHHQKIREDIDILIINSGYGTGLKFDSYIEFMLIHSHIEDTRKQVRGRYSGNLEKLLYPDKSLYDVIIIPDEYLNKDLFKEDKQRLAEELELKNENNRLIKWPTISKRIKEQKIYDIEEGKRKGNSRPHRITERI